MDQIHKASKLLGLLYLRNHINTALVTSTLEGGVKPDTGDHFGQFLTYDACPHGKHVGVVMLATQLGRIGIAAYYLSLIHI